MVRKVDSVLKEGKIKSGKNDKRRGMQNIAEAEACIFVRNMFGIQV